MMNEKLQTLLREYIESEDLVKYSGRIDGYYRFKTIVSENPIEYLKGLAKELFQYSKIAIDFTEIYGGSLYEIENIIRKEIVIPIKEIISNWLKNTYINGHSFIQAINNIREDEISLEMI